MFPGLPGLDVAGGAGGISASSSAETGPIRNTFGDLMIGRDAPDWRTPTAQLASGDTFAPMMWHPAIVIGVGLLAGYALTKAIK